MGQPGLFFCLFSLFSSHGMEKYSTNLTINEKKRRWHAWESNPGRQDGRCRRIHRAMGVTQSINSYLWLPNTYKGSFTLAFFINVFVRRFCHRYQLYLNHWYLISLTVPWEVTFLKIELFLFFKLLRPKVCGFACLGCHIHPWQQT